MTKTKKLAMLIIALALLVCSSFALTGCSDSTYSEGSQEIEDEETPDVPSVYDILDLPDISGFEIVERKSLLDRFSIDSSGVTQYIVYDPDTMVEYTFLYSNGQATGVTVLLNADGTPKLYSPDEE